MIARNTHSTIDTDGEDVWARIAAPVPKGAISWRQDGRAVQRDGRWHARFVAYIEANTVRERLDLVVAGEWDLTLDLLPPLPQSDEEGHNCSFKARLQILGVIREDVGTGRDYKSAATDAFKRAAVRFGIGHELYAFEQNWVPVDGDSRYAKPLEDPQAVYERRVARPAGVTAAATAQNDKDLATARAARGASPATTSTTSSPRTSDDPSCPKCAGRMWDNRTSKRNPKAPDFKCRDRSCDGVVWPPNSRGGRLAAAAQGAAHETAPRRADDDALPWEEPGTTDDTIPF